jgi:hypothetical protein
MERLKPSFMTFADRGGPSNGAPFDEAIGPDAMGLVDAEALVVLDAMEEAECSGMGERLVGTNPIATAVMTAARTAMSATVPIATSGSRLGRFEASISCPVAGHASTRPPKWRRKVPRLSGMGAGIQVGARRNTKLRTDPA